MQQNRKSTTDAASSQQFVATVCVTLVHRLTTSQILGVRKGLTLIPKDQEMLSNHVVMHCTCKQHQAMRMAKQKASEAKFQPSEVNN